MDYKISNICSDLGIGKSTIYKRIDILKQTIPESDWKQNDYFYYTDDNKLFFTDKGYNYIKEFKNNSKNKFSSYSKYKLSSSSVIPKEIFIKLLILILSGTLFLSNLLIFLLFLNKPFCFFNNSLYLLDEIFLYLSFS